MLYLEDYTNFLKIHVTLIISDVHNVAVENPWWCCVSSRSFGT
jgi:hypothetical protein